MDVLVFPLLAFIVSFTIRRSVKRAVALCLKKHGMFLYLLMFLIYLILPFFFFFFSRAKGAAYGSSEARS